MVLQLFKAWIYLVLTWLYLNYAMVARQANQLINPSLSPLKNYTNIRVSLFGLSRSYTDQVITRLLLYCHIHR